MKQPLLLSFSFIAFAALQGCATITRGTSEVLVIETEPPGANVDIAPAGLRCTTPCAIELKRKGNYVLDIRKDGYEPARVNVLSQIAGAGAAGMAGNVVLGGLIGAAIDAGSGATKELKPNPVKLNLVRIEKDAAPVANPAVNTEAPAHPASTATAPSGT